MQIASPQSKPTGMERKIRKAFSRMRRAILNQPHVPKSPKPVAPGDGRAIPIRINLPGELGGGFTMVVCALDQKPTVASFITQIIAMCQATNAQLLDAQEWGLKNPTDEQPDDDNNTSEVSSSFLSPSLPIASVLSDQGVSDHAEFDLCRIRAKGKRAKSAKMIAAINKEDDQIEANGLLESGGSASPETTVGGKKRHGTGHIRVWSTAGTEQRPPFNLSSYTNPETEAEEMSSQWTRCFKVYCSNSEIRYSRDPTSVTSLFSPPAAALPAHQTHLRYHLLSQLKKVKPPRSAIPPPMICILSQSISPQATPMLNHASSAHLTVPTVSAAHSTPQRSPSQSSLNTQSPAKQKSKQDKQLEKDRQKEKEKESSTIESILLSLAQKDIGKPRLKAGGSSSSSSSNTKDKTSNKSSKKEDEEDEEFNEEERERQRKKKFEWSGGEPEVPMLFIGMRQPTQQNKKTFDATEYSCVLTSHRLLQIENHAIVRELKIGPGSGGIISIPKLNPITNASASPVAVALGAYTSYVKVHFRVRTLINDASNITESDDDNDTEDEDNEQAAAAETDNHNLEEDQHKPSRNNAAHDADNSVSDNAADEKSRGSHSRKKSHHSTAPGNAAHESSSSKRAQLNALSFDVANAEVAAYLQQYVMYMQSTMEISQSLHAMLDNPSSALTSSPYRHALLGWTMLLKSFIGPLVFGPLRLPIYTHQIKQVLARVQQMHLKSIEISSLKLLQFHLPRPELTDAGDEKEEDFIPSLSLRSFKGHPDHEYLFDVYWNCPSFLVRVEIQGKKIMSFKLELEMRGIEVSGSVILKSTPYAPEKLAVSFAALPSLSFGVGSDVVVGSVKLPFQKSIEKIITTQIQHVLQQQMQDKIVYPKWVPIYFTKSNVSLLLDRWWSIAKFPFTYSKKDDEEMMGLALVVTTQAEAVMADTMKQMRERREQMESFMMRPLYGEEEKEEWQKKEKKIQQERQQEREKVEQEQRADKQTSRLGRSNKNNDKEKEKEKEKDRDKDKEKDKANAAAAANDISEERDGDSKSDLKSERTRHRGRNKDRERERDPERQRSHRHVEEDLIDDEEIVPRENKKKKKKVPRE